MENKYRITLIIGLIAVAAFFRIWHLSYDASRLPTDVASTPPGLFPDEAMNGTNAYEAIKTGHYKLFYPENNGREGLFINLQALSMQIFGHTSFALRVVAALFGIFAVLALYAFALAYTGSVRVAFLSSFFMAVGFWPVALSRLGFRANMAPFFLTASLAVLYYIWNKRDDTHHGKILLLAACGGILFGLGFHSYIAYRVAPVILIPAFLLFLRDAFRDRSRCVLCFPALFMLFAILVVVPLALYFIHNPQDFLGRTSQISIFSQPNPVRLLFVNIGKTLGMFFFAGDFNWRHNFAGQPELWWPVAICLIVGVLSAIEKRYWAVFVWFGAMMLPVVVSAEGVPHALRSIVLIPPIFFFAGLGLDMLWRVGTEFLSERSYSRRAHILLGILIVCGLAANASQTFNLYFQHWAINPAVRAAFQYDLYDTGLYLSTLPLDIPKYVLTDEVESIDRTGRPMALEPILYATDTYLPEPEGAKNIFYITLNDLDTINCSSDCIIIPIRFPQSALFAKVKERVPNMKLTIRNNLLVGIPQNSSL